jgi:putative nucleotidyltransferase with HDIG domain
MKRSLFLYVTLVAVAASVVATYILTHYPVTLSGGKAWGGLAALMALTLLAEGSGVRMSAGRAVFSVALIPTVATVPLFGPAVAVASTALSHVLAQVLLLKKHPVKAVFNVSQLTVAVGLGSVVYYTVLGGPVLAELGEEVFNLLYAIVPMGGLIATYFVTNMALVAAVIAMDTGKAMGKIWRELGPVAFANELASSSFSLFVVFAFAELGIAGVFVVLLPLFFVHHAYGIQFKLLKQNKEILELLVKTIEAKDPYTSGHSLRVASLCQELAQALGIPGHKIEEIETAALLHDIGKIDFAYAELISSPAKLTDAEREIIRSHPDRGARLLTSISSLGDAILSAVRHHHEHYDGNGYPDGLAGEEIPVAARVIMVVDTVDAMLSDRPYRAALSVEDVTEELRRFSGRQFDPAMAAAFIELGMVEKAKRMAEADKTPLPLAEFVPAARVSVS